MKAFKIYKLNYSSISLFNFILVLIVFSASTQASENGYSITSPISGVIEQVHVKVGQSVKKGELLLQFDASLIDSNLTETKSKLDAATLNLSEAKKEFERAEELYDRTVLSEHDLQKAKIDYANAKADYASIKNLLVHRQWDKKYSQLYAPFAGKVLKLFSYSGQYVNNTISAQTLMSLEKSE